MPGTIADADPHFQTVAPTEPAPADRPLLDIAQRASEAMHRGGLVDTLAAQIEALPRGPLRLMLAERLEAAEAALVAVGAPLGLLHPQPGRRPVFNRPAARLVAALRAEA